MVTRGHASRLLGTQSDGAALVDAIDLFCPWFLHRGVDLPLGEVVRAIWNRTTLRLLGLSFYHAELYMERL